MRFAPCTRTGWHSHPFAQTLHIVSGVALLQARGGQIIGAHPGDPPGSRFPGAAAWDDHHHVTGLTGAGARSWSARGIGPGFGASSAGITTLTRLVSEVRRVENARL